MQSKINLLLLIYFSKKVHAYGQMFPTEQKWQEPHQVEKSVCATYNFLEAP